VLVLASQALTDSTRQFDPFLYQIDLYLGWCGAGAVFRDTALTHGRKIANGVTNCLFLADSATEEACFYCTGTGDCVVIIIYDSGLYMAQACARLCHQRRHLLNDVDGNVQSGGESGESENKVEITPFSVPNPKLVPNLTPTLANPPRKIAYCTTYSTSWMANNIYGFGRNGMPENRRTPQDAAGHHKTPQDTIVKTAGHPNEHRRMNFQDFDSIA